MDHNLINDIAICIMVAWVLAVAGQLLRQPSIIAYLATGFAVGPVGLGWVADYATIETISSVGLILLLFTVGLEIDLKKILSAGKAILITGGTQILGGILIGCAYFSMLGFAIGPGHLDGLYLAVAAALSSTVIIVKILYDKRELDTLPGRLTLGILILQDLVAILFLALQPNLLKPGISELLFSFGKTGILVATTFTASRYALPPLFKAVARLPELVQVGALAWCFLAAGLANYLGLSSEMGALVAGVAISTFPYTLDVTARVTSLRDFFVTLFLVALGMRVPEPTLAILGSALWFVLFVVASRFITVFLPLYWMRLGIRGSVLPAINLSQASEFSLVILALGLETGHIDKRTFDLGAYAFVILAVISSYCILQSTRLWQGAKPLLLRLGFRDLDAQTGFQVRPPLKPTIFMLGFSWTASSLLEELTQHRPDLLRELVVIDFNPEVHQRLRQRGIHVIYGDLSQRDTLIHAGVGEAEVIIATLPNTVLKGATNLRLLQQLREINATAQVVVHAELLTDIPSLYAAGASYVNVPRLLEGDELFEVIEAARLGLLDQKRTELDRTLQGRQEVIP